MSTIKDVAREAGVGVGTVSRFLNGVNIKSDNKQRIEAAILKLNFHINAMARGLKTSKTNTIGVIIPDLADVYSTTIVKSVEHALYKHGYNIFACDTWGDPEIEKKKVQILVDKMVDGLIIYPCRQDLSYLQEFQRQGIPIITLDQVPKGFECDQVLIDNVNATYTAVEWLIQNDHKRIGIISASNEVFTSRERITGYRRVHEDYGITISDELVKMYGYSEDHAFRALCELMSLDNPPTAVLACNYYTTIGAVKGIYHLDIKVPEQLSFIGFDNIGLSELVRPPLSIIVQPMDEMGTAAADLLIARITGDMKGFPSVLRLKTKFVQRESTIGLERKISY